MNVVENTEFCPTGFRCESCGVEATDLSVMELATPMGLLCLTLCPRCGASTVLPPITLDTAARLVDQHATHRAGGAR